MNVCYWAQRRSVSGGSSVQGNGVAKATISANAAGEGSSVPECGIDTALCA